MVAMETFELWVSAEVPRVRGQKQRRRRDLHGHRATQGRRQGPGSADSSPDQYQWTGTEAQPRKALAVLPPQERESWTICILVQRYKHGFGKQHYRHSYLIVHWCSFQGKKCQTRYKETWDRAAGPASVPCLLRAI